MGDNNEKEVLKVYDKYLAYFLNKDMDGINSLVKFPITYIADGECKSLNAFPVKPKEMIENKEPIGRPRQIYVGENERSYVSLEDR